LETDCLELESQRLDLLVGEIVLEREDFELRGQHVPSLLGAFEQHARLLTLQQLLQLILGQLRSRVLSMMLIGGYPTVVLTLGGYSSSCQKKVPLLPGFRNNRTGLG